MSCPLHPQLPFDHSDVPTGFCEWSGFSEARELLGKHFEVEFRTAQHHTGELLDGADMCVVNLTMSSEALSDQEVAALEAFTAAGGTAILNCFSNYSHNGDFLNKVLNRFGIKPVQSSFSGRSSCSFDAAEVDSCDLKQILNGGFGRVTSLSNIGETKYELSECQFTRLQLYLNARGARMTYLPDVDGGKALVCTNLHWLCNKNAWNGGYINQPHHQRFLLNLAAASCGALKG